jgi:molecular chaperone HtpG
VTTAEQHAGAETLPFQAEVNQVLHLVIHSLYSHKEVFLRELISNASDALDKLRFRAITEPELLRDEPALEIRLIPDTEKGTLTIEDSGVGMSREELAQNLGTIAHSGSRAFLEQLAKRSKEAQDSPDKGRKDLNLIGQFGVGFYSSYLVSDRVEVVSRQAGDGHTAWRWTSDGQNTFTLEPAERGARGTAVILHLKADQKQFLEDWSLRDLVRRYSDYVSHPIQLRVGPPAGSTDVVPKYETVNRASALWQRAKSEITDEQYNEFYQHLTHDHEPPLGRTHFRVEGAQEFVGLLFIPKRPPFDMDHSKRGVRLFVRRVFVMDNCEELLPDWLRFVRGVVDSDDLPLNVSRELLQDSAVVRAIKRQVTKKALELLEEIARDRADDYVALWRSFAPTLKAGIGIDYEHRDRLAQLARYESSALEPGKLTSLADYVKRMPEGQPAIYYAFGDSRDALAGSPHLEALVARNYEVLFMTDGIDEFAVDALREFEKKPLVSVMRANLDLAKTDDEKKATEERGGALKPLLERMRGVLQEQVEEVRVSDRLTESPCCLVVPEGAHHAYVERLLKSHGHQVALKKRILEVNPNHPLIESLRALNDKDPASQKVTEWIETLYDQALLTEGSPLPDPNRFARRVGELLAKAAESAIS